MRNRELIRQLQVLRTLMARACAATPSELELLSHWARYFTVLAAGFVENAVPLVYEEYIRRRAHGAVADFALSHLERVQNPKSTRLIEIARQFSATWATDLENYLENDGRKDAINGIMSTRHLIAHGQSVNITVARITEYLAKAEAVIEFMENQVTP